MDPEEKYLSPTGTYVFHIAAWEARMSHWIESFTLVELASGASVLRLRDSNWSLDTAEWLSESEVRMQLRKYPGNHTPSSFEVRVNCEAQTAQVNGGLPMSLNKVEPALNRLYASAKRA